MKPRTPAWILAVLIVAVLPSANDAGLAVLGGHLL